MRRDDKPVDDRGESSELNKDHHGQVVFLQILHGFRDSISIFVLVVLREIAAEDGEVTVRVTFGTERFGACESTVAGNIPRDFEDGAGGVVVKIGSPLGSRI